MTTTRTRTPAPSTSDAPKAVSNAEMLAHLGNDIDYVRVAV